MMPGRMMKLKCSGSVGRERLTLAVAADVLSSSFPSRQNGSGRCSVGFEGP